MAIRRPLGSSGPSVELEVEVELEELEDLLLPAPIPAEPREIHVDRASSREMGEGGAEAGQGTQWHSAREERVCACECGERANERGTNDTPNTTNEDFQRYGIFTFFALLLTCRGMTSPPSSTATSQRLVVQEICGKGRGVIAGVSFKAGDLVECAHCILIPSEQCAAADQTVLREYTYKTAGGQQLLALNHGSLFNHSRSPNLTYEKDLAALVIRYYAARAIAAGEELTIFYGHKLWFDDTDNQRLAPVRFLSDSDDDTRFLVGAPDALAQDDDDDDDPLYSIFQ